MLGLGSMLISVTMEVFPGTMTSTVVCKISRTVSMGFSNAGLISIEARMDLSMFKDSFLNVDMRV